MAILAPLNHEATAQAVTAERKVSKVFGGSCQVPLAAFATVEAGRMHLRAMVATPDGLRMASAEVSGPAADPEALGEQVAELLRAQDAVDILASCLSDAAQADADSRSATLAEPPAAA
jgi:hydroxymethylbilane synthase